MIDIVVQVLLFLTGGIAVYLTQQGDQDLKKFACIFGVVGQPFWWYAALSAEQYGIFALTLLYTYSWVLGVYNNWIKGADK